MIDKALLVILFMYGTSVAYLSVEYVMIDVFHITVTNYDGDTLTGSLVVSWMQLTNFNEISGDIVNGTFNENTTAYNRVETFTTAAAAVAWNLIQLLSGLYIFNLILFLGVPWPFVTGMAVLYMILLARAIVGYVRGL